VATLAPAVVQPIKPEEVKPAVALKTFKQGEDRASMREGENVIIADPPLPVKDFSVLRGPRAYVREDHAQPKLAVGVFFQGGRLLEDQSTSGMTELMLRLMMKSTTTKKADLIALELESYGGEMQIVNESDFFGFTLDVLSRNADNAVKLLLDVVENPYFDKDELARERDGLLARQLEQRDDGVARSLELLWASLYPGHPYGLPRYGLPAAIKAINEEKLEAWHARVIKRQFPLVIIVGDTDGSALVSRIFSEGFKRSELDQTLKVNLPTTLPAPQEQVETRSRKQTAQAVGFRAPEGKGNDPYALAVLQNFTSGFGGRIFTELRDRQSLAYSVRFSYQPRLAGGALVAYLATLPENEQRARDSLRAELEKLVSVPPSDEELERGRHAAIGSYAIALESHPARALEYAQAVFFGRKATDVEAQPDLIRAVKKEDIKRVAEAIIKLNQMGRGAVRGEAAPQPTSKN
jgi:zinc protease